MLTKKTNMKLFLILMLILLVINISSAQQNESNKISNETLILEQKLNLSKENLQILKEQNIPTNRYVALLNSTIQLLEAQKALEKSGGTPNFEIINQRIIELNKINEAAIRSFDELIALEAAIKEFEQKDDELLKTFVESARNEFETERFELAIEEIDKAYSRMSELEAFNTKIKAAYDATSRTLWNFIYTIRYYLIGFLILLTLSAIFGRKQFLKYKTKQKIKNLEFKKKVIKDLMAKAQKQYFEDNTLSESMYHVRTKKYAELLRDINRQKPLLEERLSMLNNKKFKNSKKGD